MIDYANFLDPQKNVILFDGSETGIYNALSYTEDDFFDENIGLDLSFFFENTQINTDIIVPFLTSYLSEYGLEYELMEVSEVDKEGNLIIIIKADGVALNFSISGISLKYFREVKNAVHTSRRDNPINK